nr:hypothetical protein [Bacteroidota bacterium]
MKRIFANLFTAIVIFAISLSVLYPTFAGTSPEYPIKIDTARIATVEFTVYGMDSLTIETVQDALDTTTGVSFNFACWTDTVVFIEYDSVLTNPDRLMHLLKNMGYPAKVRVGY